MFDDTNTLSFYKCMYFKCTLFDIKKGLGMNIWDFESPCFLCDQTILMEICCDLIHFVMDVITIAAGNNYTEMSDEI